VITSVNRSRTGGQLDRIEALALLELIARKNWSRTNHVFERAAGPISRESVISEIAEALAVFVEFAVSLAEIPIRHPRPFAWPGDVFRARRFMTVSAVIPPLTREATRFDVSVAAGARLRVTLAIPAKGHHPYLAFVDPADCGPIPAAFRDRALLAGLWLEIPMPVLILDFRRSRY
jgi:hypothetical protein